MVADGSAYVGSKEMSLLYTNVAADLSAVLQKNRKNRVLAPFQGIFRPFLRAKSIFLLFSFFFWRGAASLDAA